MVVIYICNYHDVYTYLLLNLKKYNKLLSMLYLTNMIFLTNFNS